MLAIRGKSLLELRPQAMHDEIEPRPVAALAKALGLAAGTLKAGALADVVLLNPKAAWTPAAADLFSKSGNNPLVGRALTGRVRATFVGGRQVFGA
jgi:dihydroorotase-like cyclic amidohydrolase